MNMNAILWDVDSDTFENILKNDLPGLLCSFSFSVLGIYKLIFELGTQPHNRTRGCIKFSLSSLAFVVIYGVLDGSHSVNFMCLLAISFLLLRPVNQFISLLWLG